MIAENAHRFPVFGPEADFTAALGASCDEIQLRNLICDRRNIVIMF